MRRRHPARAGAAAAYPLFSSLWSSLWSAVGLTALALPALADSSLPPQRPCPLQGATPTPPAKVDEAGAEKGKGKARAQTPAPAPKKKKHDEIVLMGLMGAPIHPMNDPASDGQAPGSGPRVLHAHGPDEPCFPGGERLVRLRRGGPPK